MKKYISFDIGGTKVKHAVIDKDGEILAKNSYDTNSKDLDIFVNDILRVINDYKSKYDIEGIGISLPGFINPKTGYSEKAGAIEALHYKNLKEILQEKVNVQVEIDNDANCVALAEKYSGNAVNCKNYVCMTIGTGVGGAIVIDGNLLYGHSFRGGEIGFMTIRDDKDGLGTINQNASTRGLIEEFKKYKGIDKSAVVEGNVVFHEAEIDKNLAEIVDNWFERLSCAVFNLAAILNPEKILIGGGISDREDFIENVLAHLNKNKYWDDIKVEICACKHKNDAGMLGAVYNFIQS